MSDDASVIAYEASQGGAGGRHAFVVHDRTTGTTREVPAPGASGPQLGAPTVFPDGTAVAHVAAVDGSGRPAILVHDLGSGSTRALAVRSDGSTSSGSSALAVSGDGASLAFESRLDLVPGDTNDLTDVFVRSLPG